MNPGSDIVNGAASELTGRPPAASDASMPRRVGSASAANTALSAVSEDLTIWLSI